MAGLTIKNVSKQFKDSNHATLKDINLHIDNDEFLVLLGPSGCGKTTLLRMISGLTKPTEGRIYVDDVDITDLEPQERGVGMVFQNYALFPHMSIHKNLTFPLELAGVKKSEREKAVNAVGEMLDIKKHFKKKPEMLSGGERQRVAMGRAMVKESKLYLFDEPLSNLDDGLRTKLRPEIKKLFHDLKVPFVFVTHDQVDAMTLATKIAVMDKGEVQQLGAPQEIYDTPASMFVAGFIGVPKINFLNMNVRKDKEGILLTCGNIAFTLPEHNDKLVSYVDKQIVLGIRPEDLMVTKTGHNLQQMEAVLVRYEHLGNKVQLYVEVDGNTLCVAASVTVRAKVGQKLTIYLNKDKVHLFDAETQLRI